MKRILFGIAAFAVAMTLATAPAESQPPEGKGGAKDGKGGGKDGKLGAKDGKGGMRFELGQVFPPPLQDELNLTPAQEKQLDSIKKDLKTKLDKLLTDEQKKTVENFRPMFGGKGGVGDKDGKGPPKGDKGGGGDKGDRPDRPPFEKSDKTSEMLPPAREVTSQR